ncbi:MAG: hypothetical protein IIA44_08080 [Acidobacteria bacterium]|nr:hypothetical protein [Acidobacteriota bacterium]
MIWKPNRALNRRTRRSDVLLSANTKPARVNSGIAGIDADGVEAAGWDAVVQANLDFNDVTRTSATVVTITLGAEAGYGITAAETITVTVPDSALVLGGPVVATPTFQVTTSAAPAAVLTGTLADDATEAEIVTGGETLVITLTSAHWEPTVGADNAITQAVIDGLDAAGVEATGWDYVVQDNLDFTDVVRTSDTVVTITLGAEAAYVITATETITATVPATALLTSSTPLVATPTFQVTVATAGGLQTYQTINVQADGTTQDTVCDGTTQFTSAQTVKLLAEPLSCAGTKEDKIKWTFGATEGTNETTC